MNTKIPVTHIENLIGPDKVMDVREIPCSIKHGLILRTCFELPVGDHFILWNGHDPVHLREQTSVFWPGAFSWDYVTRKPDEVRVKVTKLKPLTENIGLPPDHECSH